MQDCPSRQPQGHPLMPVDQKDLINLKGAPAYFEDFEGEMSSRSSSVSESLYSFAPELENWPRSRKLASDL